MHNERLSLLDQCVPMTPILNQMVEQMNAPLEALERSINASYVSMMESSAAPAFTMGLALEQLTFPSIDLTFLNQIGDTIATISDSIMNSLKPLFVEIERFCASIMDVLANSMTRIAQVARQIILSVFSVDDAELDAMLAKIKSTYTVMRRSAWRTYGEKVTEEYARQAAVSMRQLYVEYIRSLHPGKNDDEKVRNKLSGQCKKSVDLIAKMRRDVLLDLNKQCHTSHVGEVVDLELLFRKAQFLLFVLLNPQTLDAWASSA